MTSVDVAELIDKRPISWLQIRVVALCALVQFLDGFDTQAIAYVAPALSKAWSLDRSALGPVFGAGIAGILSGSLFIGPFADRLGRKRLMVVAVIVFGVFTLMTAQSTSMRELFIYRFLAGLGLGGVIPSTVVMASEFAPLRRRATMVTLMACGFALGAASGGLLVGSLLPYGWQSIFYVGGIAPLILAVLLIVWMPESLRFLVASGGDRARTVAILRKIDPAIVSVGDALFTLPSQTPKGFSVAELFRDRRAGSTCLLWLAFFFNLFSLNFLNNWLPTVISSTMTVQEAVLTTTLFQFGGMAGVISMGVLADRFGFYRVLATGFIAASLCTALIGFAGSKLILSVVLCLGGFCIIGVQMTLSALSAALYPTAIRATGAGWASGIGRIGSFAGPVAGGLLLAVHPRTETVFIIIAAPTLAGAVCVIAMSLLRRAGRHRRPAVDVPVGST